MNNQPSAERIEQVAFGFMKSKLLFSAIELGLFTELRHLGPRLCLFRCEGPRALAQGPPRARLIISGWSKCIFANHFERSRSFDL